MGSPSFFSAYFHLKRQLEEPVPAQTLQQMSRLVAANLGVNFSLGERLCGRWGFKDVLEQNAADIIQPDVCHAGGI